LKDHDGDEDLSVPRPRRYAAGQAMCHLLSGGQKHGEVRALQSPNGEYRWRLKATNGQVIATGGEGYSSKAAAQNGIASVKRAAADASVEEV
jgi:uncharacterized protein